MKRNEKKLFLQNKTYILQYYPEVIVFFNEFNCDLRALETTFMIKINNNDNSYCSTKLKTLLSKITNIM